MVFDLLELDGRAGRRPAARGAATPARGAPRPDVGERARSRRRSRTGRRCSRRRRAQGLEGVVAKRARRAVPPGPTDARLAEAQAAAARTTSRSSGSRAGTGRRAKLGALVLARREADGLHWAGNVGSGLGDGDVDTLLAALRPLERRDVAARRRAAHAARPRGGRHVGRAVALGRGEPTRRRRAKGGSARRCSSGSATMCRGGAAAR